MPYKDKEKQLKYVRDYCRRERLAKQLAQPFLEAIKKDLQKANSPDREIELLTKKLGVLVTACYKAFKDASPEVVELAFKDLRKAARKYGVDLEEEP